MKIFRLSSLIALIGLLAGGGCGSLEVASGGNPDRVLTGSVNAGVALPAGSEVFVRLLAPATQETTARPGTGELPVVTRPSAQNVDLVLGEFEQTLTAGTTEPVPFRIPYNADDALLRRGLNIEARVSVGGKLRYRNVNAHVVTLASSAYGQEVMVQPVAR